MNEEQKTTTPNGKLSRIFLAVLVVHVVVIVAFIGYNLLKGNTSAESENLANQSAIEEGLPEAVSPELAKAQPNLDTDQSPVADSGAPSNTETTTAMSMPVPEDPIYDKNTNHSVTTTVPVAPAKVQSVVSVPFAEPSPVLIPVTPATPVTPVTEVTTNLGTYAVVKGDSLVKIARMHQVTLLELRSANNLKNDNLKIGQLINIPSIGKKQAVISAVTVAKVAPASGVKTGVSEYKVAAGDTLWKIAKTFNTQPSQIAKLNGITDPSKLKVGSTIKVPTSSSQEASAPKAQPVRTNVTDSDVAMVPKENR